MTTATAAWERLACLRALVKNSEYLFRSCREDVPRYERLRSLVETAAASGDLDAYTDLHSKVCGVYNRSTGNYDWPNEFRVGHTASCGMPSTAI